MDPNEYESESDWDETVDLVSESEEFVSDNVSDSDSEVVLDEETSDEIDEESDDYEFYDKFPDLSLEALPIELQQKIFDICLYEDVLDTSTRMQFLQVNRESHYKGTLVVADYYKKYIIRLFTNQARHKRVLTTKGAFLSDTFYVFNDKNKYTVPWYEVTAITKLTSISRLKKRKLTKKYEMFLYVNQVKVIHANQYMQNAQYLKILAKLNVMQDNDSFLNDIRGFDLEQQDYIRTFSGDDKLPLTRDNCNVRSCCFYGPYIRHQIESTGKNPHFFINCYKDVDVGVICLGFTIKLNANMTSLLNNTYNPLDNLASLLVSKSNFISKTDNNVIDVNLNWNNYYRNAVISAIDSYAVDPFLKKHIIDSYHHRGKDRDDRYMDRIRAFL